MRMMLAVIGLMAFLGAEGKLAPPKISAMSTNPEAEGWS